MPDTSASKASRATAKPRSSPPRSTRASRWCSSVRPVRAARSCIRNFGEAVENLTAAGEYHWMAGNFLKYGAAESRFGSRNAGDLPVDSHELIALVAPRWVFVSYGVPEKGDANWLDHQGSYMAVVAAGPVFRLLGARDVGDTRDYHVATMPGVNVGRLDGELAWRQHDG